MGFFKFRSIQTKLVFSIIVFMALPIITLSYYTARSTEKIIYNNVEGLTMNTLKQLNENFQQILDSMLAIANVVEMDRDFTKLLSDEDYDTEYDIFLQLYFDIIAKLLLLIITIIFLPHGAEAQISRKIMIL